MSSIYLNWDEYPPEGLRRGAMTIGNFDGVHRGHEALLKYNLDQAKAIGGPAIAMTFDPPPMRLLAPQSVPLQLTTMADRIDLLHQFGIDHVVVLRTTPELLALSAEAYFEDILQRRFDVRGMVEGFNFRFGNGRLGDVVVMRRLCEAIGIPFVEVPSQTIDGVVISSSQIRAALLAHDIPSVTAWLGRRYSITGQVIKGQQRGRTLGFPTANLNEVQTLIPGEGVYAVSCRVGNDPTLWPGAANIGSNPTFGEEQRKIEVHLIGFAGNLYDQSLHVDFVHFLRATRPFSGPNELIEQLKQDMKAAKTLVVEQ
jgi:riboflavin kinase/FMN adenylyltransferase